MAQLKDTVVSGSLRATDSLLSTTAQFNILGIGYNPNTSGNTYALYVNGTSFFNNTITFNNGPAAGSIIEIQGAASQNFSIALTNGAANIDIGWNWASGHGSGLALRAASQNGEFLLYARKDTATEYKLKGTATGELYWTGAKFAVNTSTEQSYNFYVSGTSNFTNTIRLENGSNNWNTPSQFQIIGPNNRIFSLKPTSNGQNIDVGWDWASADGAGAAFRNADGNGGFSIFARKTINDAVTANELVGSPVGLLTWSGAKFAVNSTSEPSYNFYVNGTSYFNGIITSNSALHLVPATGEGGQINLFASTENTTQAGIALDQYNSTFRIFGIASADGTTKTGIGTPLIIDPYAETITGGYTITGDLSGTATIATILSTSADSGFISDQHGNFKHKRATNTDYWQLQDNTGATKFGVYWETGAITITNTITHTATGVSYISGAAGTNAAIYAKKAAGSVWRPAITLQTSGSGSWQIGNCNDETLEFQYATAENITSQTNTTSEIYMQNGDTGRVITSGNYNSYALPLSGGTMTGALTFANNTWNNVGDDCAMGDQNVAGALCIKGLNGTTQLRFIQQGGTAAGAITWNGTSIAMTNCRIGYTNTSYVMSVSSFICQSWIRTTGNTGWYNETHAGGIYMIDSTYVRVYNDKDFYVSHNSDYAIYTAGGFASSRTSGVFLKSYYNDTWYTILHNHGNGNLSLSSYGGGLFLGYWNTNTIYLHVSGAERGKVDTQGVKSAVWNDFAEFRKSDYKEPGRVVIDNGTGTMILCNTRLAAGARLISDTYGMSVGYSLEQDTPIGVGGRVLAYPYQDRNNYHVGDAVCSAPNGTIDIMTRDEIMMYPERILGTVSEIPEYKIWTQYAAKNSKAINIEVKGRIWIYVR